ncbi:hypothetical protein CONPUDRAFT_144460 [Coniophora puteana RWD-64-598 SS2]|uniref:Uncharacterized protein n=1 Tax=Coniophora puteana (strain RWD-64-598) TaxID=741705 RepID=A0A5M3MML0_CONPW|nr:uncharacterized protein CONPUDRAFT_144460 [Coniophora puteana RWD-64-598 SS2]EIW80343.1 hypothetical protein CONPUDRAFT_144460 [Coniophora puteana RWD-64-598 SS2]
MLCCQSVTHYGVDMLVSNSDRSGSLGAAPGPRRGLHRGACGTGGFIVYLNSGNATQANITPIISQISAPLNNALGSVNGLKSQGVSQNELLLSEDGSEILSVGALAALIAADLVLLFKAIGVVLAIVGADLLAILIPLLYAVGILVYKILFVVLGLVSGLLFALTPLLSSIVGVLDTLGLTVLLLLLAL